MTMDVYSLNYLNHLNYNIYSQFTDTKLYPYPNINLPQHKGKEITQYHFTTKTHPVYTALHSLWYKWDNDKNKFLAAAPKLFQGAVPGQGRLWLLRCNLIYRSAVNKIGYLIQLALASG